MECDNIVTLLEEESRDIAPKVERALGHEVLQASSLHDFPWPSDDPSSVAQPSRLLDDDDRKLLKKAAGAIRFNREAFDRQTRDMDTTGKIHHFLTGKAVNFNGVTAARSEPLWLQRIERAVRAGKPIVLTYPLMCKIANSAKQFQPFGVHAGEEATVIFFKKLNEIVRTFYQPGLCIKIASDAVLYNTTLQNPVPTAIHYIEQLRELVDRHGAKNCIEIYDYATLLVPFAREYQVAYDWFFERLREDDSELLADARRSSLARSVRASVNTARFGLDYKQLRQLFGPNVQPGDPIGTLIDSIASVGLRDQIAVKMACDRLNIFERIWPDNIRVSCHRGTKHGRTVIGLRVYPAYYLSSKLLPYHGVPLILADRRGLPKLDIQPEIVLRGRPELLRVINEHGETWMYRKSKLA